MIKSVHLSSWLSFLFLQIPQSDFPYLGRHAICMFHADHHCLSVYGDLTVWFSIKFFRKISEKRRVIDTFEQGPLLFLGLHPAFDWRSDNCSIILPCG